MTHRQQTSIAEIALSRITGIVIFLIFVALLNLVAGPSSGPVLSHATTFVNANVGLILAFSVLFFIGDLSSALGFPWNLPGPVFNAAGAVLMLGVLARLFVFVDAITGITIFSVFERLLPILAPLVFFIVLAAGYWAILTDGQKRAP
jgi:hypothetical protein